MAPILPCLFSNATLVHQLTCSHAVSLASHAMAGQINCTTLLLLLACHTLSLNCYHVTLDPCTLLEHLILSYSSIHEMLPFLYPYDSQLLPRSLHPCLSNNPHATSTLQPSLSFLSTSKSLCRQEHTPLYSMTWI